MMKFKQWLRNVAPKEYTDGGQTFPLSFEDWWDETTKDELLELFEKYESEIKKVS